MLAFVTEKEGGKFYPLKLPGSLRPKEVVSLLWATSCIIVFKCGMIHDSFIEPILKSTWRHKFDGGRKAGKVYYNELYNQLMKRNHRHAND